MLVELRVAGGVGGAQPGPRRLCVPERGGAPLSPFSASLRLVALGFHLRASPWALGGGWKESFGGVDWLPRRPLTLRIAFFLGKLGKKTKLGNTKPAPQALNLVAPPEPAPLDWGGLGESQASVGKFRASPGGCSEVAGEFSCFCGFVYE